MEKENTFHSFFALFRIKEDIEMVGPNEIPDFERRFLFPLSILGIIFSLSSIILDFFWHFNEVLRIIVWTSFFLYLIFFFYFLTKRVKYFTLVKWLFILFSIFLINFAWYFDYRSNGPVLYTLVLLYGYLVFMLWGKQRLISSILLLMNLLVLFFLDYRGVLPRSAYSGEGLRLVESYSAVALYGMVAFILMKIVNRIYMKEYNKALESDRLKTSFLANISHEIRTPLNAIVGFSNLMLTEDVTMDERKNYKAIINQNNKFLLELVNDILDISMIESNNVQREDELNNLNQVVSDLEKAYSKILTTLGKEDIRLVKVVPEDKIFINIDRNYLNRALRHLLDNAVKFTQEGSIEFGFSVEGKFIRFFIKDTGIGIKEKDKNMLFKRFNKFEYSKERVHSGTGIGLYLVKLIVKMFEGDVSAESTYGKGSTFSFTIPAKELKIDK